MMMTITALVAGCVIGQADAPLKVVVANDVAADLVRAIGGGAVDLVVLGGAGNDPHHFEPTPADGKKVESADLVIQFGLGLDRAIGALHVSTHSKATLLVLAPAAPGATNDHGSGGTHDHHDHSHDHAAHSNAIDPHIWHDPSKVQALNARVCAALSAARPALAATFQARSRALDDQLTALDTWIKEQVQVLPPDRRVIVTTHAGLQSFATRYGFQVIALELGADGAGADPSPRKLIALVEALRATKSPAIFGEAGHPSRIAATVAKEANVKLVETLYIDTLLPPPAGRDGKAYLETMKANVNAIVGALRQ